ncbi:MAG: hypothetical protein O3A87_09025 [Verrucomicrobia bacterium]|nr:hypothetical protein [Verrucomicrobiota bacterium]
MSMILKKLSGMARQILAYGWMDRSIRHTVEGVNLGASTSPAPRQGSGRAGVYEKYLQIEEILKTWSALLRHWDLGHLKPDQYNTAA